MELELWKTTLRLLDRIELQQTKVRILCNQIFVKTKARP